MRNTRIMSERNPTGSRKMFQGRKQKNALKKYSGDKGSTDEKSRTTKSILSKEQRGNASQRIKKY